MTPDETSVTTQPDDVLTRIESLLQDSRSRWSSDPRAALRTATDALVLARDAQYMPGIAGALRNEAVCLLILGRSDEAVPRLEQAHESFVELGDLKGQASCLNNLANVHFYRGHHAEALHLYERSLDLARQAPDPIAQANAYNNISGVYLSLGDYALAYDYQRQSLGAREELADRDGVAMSLNNIGEILLRLGRADEAVARLEESLALARTTGNAITETHVLINLAEGAQALGRHDQALHLREAAIDLAEERGFHETRSQAVLGKAESLLALERHDDALHLLQELTVHLGETGEEHTRCSAFLAKGQHLSRAGRHPAAHAALTEALGTAVRLGAKREELRAHELLAELSERQGHLADALAHYKAFHALEREVARDDVDRRVLAYSLQRQADLARRDAEAHRQRSQELEQIVSQLAQSNDEKEGVLRTLNRQLVEDPLTGLYNRRYVEEVLRQAFTSRAPVPVASLLIDADHFKLVNDRFGHAAGDEVLRQLAELIRANVRAGDTAARYGGEEFVVLLVDAPTEAAVQTAERVRQAVERYDWSGRLPGLSVTVSIGVSTSARTPDELLRRADAQLYRAKHAGRNQVSVDSRIL